MVSVSVSQLARIEETLRRGAQDGDNGRVCKDYVGKLRRWLAAGQSPADVRHKLEQMVGRFGSVRY